MVTKSKAAQKRGKVKVGKLKLNRETVKDLSLTERKDVKGGLDRLSVPILSVAISLPVIKSVDKQCRLTEGPTCGAP